jgi:hypothetical protein
MVVEMPKRQNPDFILVGVGGSVSKIVRAKLYLAAKNEGVSVSGYIGRVLSDYADTLPQLVSEVDPNQRGLFEKWDSTESILEQRRLEKKQYA